MSKDEPSAGEISARREAAYDRVREQLKKTSERTDAAMERWRKKLERAIERDDDHPTPVPGGAR